LGAQRRAVTGSDLPEAARRLREFLADAASFENGPMAHKVARTRIGENGEWSLSGERYRAGNDSDTSFPLIALGDTSVFQIESGGTPKSTEDSYWGGVIHWATLVDLPQTDFISQITSTARTISEAGLKNSSAKVLPSGTVIVSSRATIGRVGIARIPLATNQGFKNIIIRDETKAIPEFVAFMVKQLTPKMESLATGGTFKEISKGTMATLEIPLPPLAIQQEIVAEIEGYQKIIDGARQVVENYLPRIAMQADWPKVKLGDIAEFKNGLNYSATGEGRRIKILGVSHFKDYVVAPVGELVETQVGGEVDDAYLLREGDILFVRSNGNQELVGRSVILPSVNEPISFSGFTIRCRLAARMAIPKFYAYLFKSVEHRDILKDIGRGASIRNLSQGVLKELDVPLPDLETQRAIVAEIEAEQALVESARQLIARFEAKIKTAINRVWGGDA
ncbi:MAG: restriction endonuclease subunit M/S, partial [Rhodocyclaceae bacterium]|nr:restriction endonuclease subunit M/S [Rhodocyclaceae bacterium]